MSIICTVTESTLRTGIQLVFHHHCYPPKVYFIVFFFSFSLWGKKLSYSLSQKSLLTFLCCLGCVQTVRPRRVSGLPVILYLDSHIRVRFVLVLFASYLPGFCTNGAQVGGQTGDYKMLHPDPQPGLVFQHVLNMGSQVVLIYGPCIINGIFSTDSLIFFFY